MALTRLSRGYLFPADKILAFVESDKDACAYEEPVSIPPSLNL